MFVPHTAHVSRSYGGGHHIQGGHPTTSRKNVNKENAFALPSKTPSRNALGGPSQGGALLGKPGVTPGPSMRPGLGVKTEMRNRNIMDDGGAGGGGKGDKGKGKEGMGLGEQLTFSCAVRASIASGPSRESS